MKRSLKSAVEAGEFILAPGLHDMIAAVVSNKIGFDFVYASGYWMTASAHGLPDAGIATYTEMLGRVATLVRTDLYFADEAFLCGTAAEVTPIASVDGQEIGGRGPITKQIQEVFFATVEGRDERFAEFLEYPVTEAVSS